MSDNIKDTLAALSEAVKATEYKYFGDYEFSDNQRKAVDTLVDAANAILSGQLVPVPSVEVVKAAMLASEDAVGWLFDNEADAIATAVIAAMKDGWE